MKKGIRKRKSSRQEKLLKLKKQIKQGEYNCNNRELALAILLG